MEMEDQNHTNQYGMDLRQFISGRPTASSSHFPPLIPHHPPELFPAHRTLQAASHHHYNLSMLVPGSGLHLHELPGGSPAPVATSATATLNIATTSTEGEGGCFGVGGGDIGGAGRWPRQETLTLLEIRSSLDSKFKEATQKGPLWEEVSRIMAEEHGYHRSGKKCREKFENLYKYYKKTKEGKAGRQDGKHYRFFRQLEALYGETSNSNPSSSAQDHGHFVGFNQAINPSSSSRPNTTTTTTNPLEVFDSHVSLSLSNSSGYETSSEEEDQSTEAMRRKRRWKAKVKEFLDAQMRKLAERQEAWLERLTCSLEEKEKERLRKEEEWMKRETERVDREHMFWAKEREWIEARDAALMEALQKLTPKDHHQHQVNVSNSCPEGVIGAHHREEISGKDVKEEGVNKKRREDSNSRSSSYFIGNESMYHPGGEGGFSEINNNNGQSLGSGSINGGNNVVSDSCFRFLMGGNIEGEILWDNYGFKPSKGGGGGGGGRGDHGSQ